MEAIGVIRNTNRVEPYAIHLSDLITKVLRGGDLRANTQYVATSLGFGDLEMMMERDRPEKTNTS